LPPAPSGIWNEFKAFIENYNVMGFAMGFILVLYPGQLMRSMITDLRMLIWV